MAGSLRIAIAGGGIGGFAAALALAKHGIASDVYERRAEFAEEGAGIQIGPNGTRILRQLGVADDLAKRVGAPDFISVRDGASGQQLTQLPLGRWIASRHGAPYWTASRADLHAALRRTASREPLITVRPSQEITQFSESPLKVELQTSSGETHGADALIAADGLWSALRNQISGATATPAPIGKTAYRSLVNATALSASSAAHMRDNAVHLWLASSAHVVHYPVNAGRDIAIVVITNTPNDSRLWSERASASDLNQATRGFAAPLRQLISAAPEWRQWALHALPQLPRWTNGKAALLGDAAHPVRPFLAQGAVLALEDAMILAKHLSQAASLDHITAALAAYAKEREARAWRVAEASRRNGEIYHMSGLAAGARDTVMKLAPSSLLMARFDWLYGWHV